MLSVRSNRAPLVLGAQDFNRALTQPSRVGKRVAPVLLVKQVMRSPGKKLVTLDESGTIRDALRQLISAKTTGAPVLNNRGELIGVVSLTDLMWAEATRDEEESPENPLWLNQTSPFYVLDDQERAQEDEVLSTPLSAVVANQEPVTVEPNRQLSQAASIMLKEKVKRLPVCERGSKVVQGMVTRDDVLRIMAAAIDDPNESFDELKASEEEGEFPNE